MRGRGTFVQLGDSRLLRIVQSSLFLIHTPEKDFCTYRRKRRFCQIYSPAYKSLSARSEDNDVQNPSQLSMLSNMDTAGELLAERKKSPVQLTELK